MKEAYWNKFMVSGSIVDYLDYTNYEDVHGSVEDRFKARGDDVEAHANARRSNRNRYKGGTYWGV